MDKVVTAIVGNRPLLRTGIRHSLEAASEIEVLLEADLSQAAVSLVSDLSPDLLIVDVGPHEMLATSTARQVKLANPHMVMVAALEREDSAQVSALAQIGVNGFLTSNASNDDLVKIVRGAQSGKLVVEKQLENMLADSGPVSARDASIKDVCPLTSREMEILRIVAEGGTNSEVAAKLILSDQTIKGHLANIYSKLGARSRTDAVFMGVKRGWLGTECRNVFQQDCDTAHSSKRQPGTACPTAVRELSDPGRRDDEARDNSTSEFLHLFDDIDEGCCLIQGNRYVFANRAIADMLGYSKKELTGKSFVERVPLRLREPINRLHRRRLSGDNVPTRYALSLRRRDGSNLFVNLSLKLVWHRYERAVAAILSDSAWSSSTEKDILDWIRTSRA